MLAFPLEFRAETPPGERARVPPWSKGWGSPLEYRARSPPGVKELELPLE
jgi:hypothetical protein